MRKYRLPEEVHFAAQVTNSQQVMVALGFINGQNDTGEGGNAAVYTGQTSESASTVGFHLTGHFAFNVTDKAGAQSGTITFGVGSTNDTLASNENFTIAKEQMVSILNQSNISTTDVNWRFDSGNRLDFTVEVPGKEVVL